jgi:hypothetical protein
MAELLRYPLTKLESSDDYLKITALEYKAPGFSPVQNSPTPLAAPTAGDPRDVKKELDYFILPIPEDIKDTNATGWGESSLNPLEAGTAGLLQNLGSLDINAIKNTANTALDELTGGSAQKFYTALGIKLGTNILFGGNTSIDKTLSRYAGAVTNSNIELIFSGVSLRQPFSFAFDMVPRSQKEAQVVKQIIRKFKKYSAAKRQGVGTGSGLFLKAPDVFRLEYMSGGNRHPYLNRFKICALTGVGVNYTGSGTYATYSDGAPVNIVLSLTFKELSPIYAEDYDTGIGAEGTGF